MKNEDIKNQSGVSLLLKISGMFCILLLLVIVILEITSIRYIQATSLDAVLLMGRNKLSGDIASFEDKFTQEYGQPGFRNGDLFDKNGNSIKNDFRVVDEISSRLGVHATIYARENENYRLVSTSILDASGNRFTASTLGSENAAYSTIKSGRDYFGETTLFNNDYLSAYKPLFDSSNNVIGSLFIGIEMAGIHQHISNAVKEKIFSLAIEAIIILAVAMIITFFFVRSFIKPIVRVTLTLKDISEGEGDLTKRIITHSRDEVGMLSTYFNLTLGKINNLVLSIKHEVALLSKIGDNLATDMNETAAAINQITSNIGNMKDRIHQQSTTVSETHLTMEELTENIHKLDKHVENQSNHISRSSAAIEQMIANIQSVTNALIKNNTNVNTLKHSSEIGRTGLSDVAADIQEIAKESEGLLEINSVMENIASQTSLLSMNAAIEAAHAGEAGKGFAVVADEIRKLAENSSAQSKTISIVLKKIKESIDKITRSTDNVLSKFEDIDSSVRTVSEQEEIIRTAMEEQGVGSKQILEGIEEVNDITRMVKSDSNDMLEEATDVIKESESLDKVTQEINSGMTEMTMGVEQINVAVNDINDISVKNRDAINILIKEVERFKVE